MDDVGEEVLAAGVHLHRGLDAADGAHGRIEAVAQGAQAGGLLRLGFLGRLQGGDEAGDAGDVLGAAAATGFLTAAQKVGGEGSAGLQVQGAHALGAADLVSREGSRIHAELLHIERHLAQGLHGIGVEEGAALVGQRRQLADGLDGAHLGIRRLHRDEHRVVGERLGQRRGLDEALAVGAQVGDEHALALEAPAGREHGIVLDGGGDDVQRAVLLAGKAALLGGRLHKAEDGRVVGLGGTGGEDDLIGAPGAQGLGRAAPSAFQKVEGGAPHPVQGVGVGVHGQIRRPGHLEGRHGAGRLGAQGGGGGVVQVDEARRRLGQGGVLGIGAPLGHGHIGRQFALDGRKVFRSVAHRAPSSPS